jgi:hypothetical protein
MLANSVKSAGRGGGGSAAKEGLKVVDNIVKAEGGDKAAAAALSKAAAAEEKRVLGTVSEGDREQLARLVAAGVAGTAEKPDAEALKIVHDNLAGMQGPNKVEYAKKIETMAQGLSPEAKAADEARQAAVRKGIAQVGEGDVAAELQIMNDVKGWDATALEGRNAVKAELATGKGTLKERFIAAWKRLWKKTGQPAEKDEDIIAHGVCGGFLKAPGVAGPYDGNPFGEKAPKFMACSVTGISASM